MVGRVISATSFDPKFALLLQNKDLYNIVILVILVPVKIGAVHIWPSFVARMEQLTCRYWLTLRFLVGPYVLLSMGRVVVHLFRIFRSARGSSVHLPQICGSVKDELQIPLDLSTIPTPKEFKAGKKWIIGKLFESPERKQVDGKLLQRAQIPTTPRSHKCPIINCNGLYYPSDFY